jgi:hypothetical protein
MVRRREDWGDGLCVRGLLAEGLRQTVISNTLGVGLAEVKRVWQSAEWLSWCVPPKRASNCHRALGDLTTMLGFHPAQYSYYSHAVAAESTPTAGCALLLDMVSGDNFVEVIGERKLAATGRLVVCFTTRLHATHHPLPVWAYLCVLQHLLGGATCPDQPTFHTSLHALRKAKVDRHTMRAQHPKHHLAAPYVSSTPLHCGHALCAFATTSVKTLRRHVTIHNHQLPLAFALKDKWLANLLRGDRFKVWLCVWLCGCVCVCVCL